jgi:phosphopantetheinyl transferase
MTNHRNDRQDAEMPELWLVDLEAAAPALEALERETPRLRPEDRARAQRVAGTRERRHRLAAYSALRILCERIAGPAIRGRSLLHHPGGKPHLGPDAPAFSLAHVDGLALIAIAPAGRIGVDLERPRSLRLSSRRREEILALGAGLASASASSPAHGRAGDEPLLHAWCRLEAFAKAHGGGISRVLTEIGIRGTTGRQLPLADIEAAARALIGSEGLAVSDLAMPPGLFAAVAAADRPRALRPRPFPCDVRAIDLAAGARPPSLRAPPR